MDRKDRIGTKEEQQRLFEALRSIRKGIQWKSGKDVVHLKKRQRMNHIPLSAMLLDYETIIIDLVNDPYSILYLYEFGEATFYGIRGFVKEREWLVIFGEGGIMETAFPPEDMDDYLGKRGFILRAYPKTSSFGPMRRSRSFSILEIVTLFLRLKKSCGLAWNQNLRFSDRLLLVR